MARRDSKGLKVKLETQEQLVLQALWDLGVFLVFLARMAKLDRTGNMGPQVPQETPGREDSLVCQDCQDQRDTVGSPV